MDIRVCFDDGNYLDILNKHHLKTLPKEFSFGGVFI